MDTAIAHARDQGLEKIVLWTLKELIPACRLYEKNGFVLTGTKAGHMGTRKVSNLSYELSL
jgi:ribosomal protein S18 acetylase RimI-like enzyme